MLSDFWKRLTDTQPKRLTVVIGAGLVGATALLAFVLLYSVELSGLVAGLWLSLVAFGLWTSFDWAIKEIDTLHALQHRFIETESGEVREYPPNLAWGLVLAGFLVMLGLAFMAGS